jgi:MFS family permease
VNRRLFILVTSLVLVETMFYSVLAPLLPHYVHDLHMSKGAAGLLTASYPIGALISAIPAGFVVARVGARRSAIAGMFLLVITCVAFGFADSPVSLDGARIIQGVAASLIWTGGLAWLVAAHPTDRRGELVGAVLGVAIGGTMLGPVVGSIASLTTTKLTFSVLAGVILVLGLTAIPSQEPELGVANRLGELAHAIRNDRRMLAGIWFTALSSALFGVLSVLGPLRLSALGAGTVGIGATFLVSAGIEASASPVIGRASDRRGPWTVIRLTLGASSLTALLLPVPDTALLFAPAVIIAALSFGGAWVPASALLSAGADERGLDQGIAFALWNMAWAAGQTAGAALGARVAEATSDAVPYVALSALCLATLVVVVRRQRRQVVSAAA